MNIARLLYPVRVLGPGNRMGIWFAGCTHGCRGCSNPELWQMQKKYETTAEHILEIVRSVAASSPIDGFTITGGDPFLQKDALRILLPKLAEISEDILVYTGFDYEEINTGENRDILDFITVLIDGKYIEERNNNCFLRGSDNQRIHILQKNLEKFYLNYLSSGWNQIQNFRTSDGFISVGIHNPDYSRELHERLLKKGIIRV